MIHLLDSTFMKSLLVVASHSGFNLKQIALGGPASLSDSLIAACLKRPGLQIRVLSSDLLGSQAPRNDDFLGYKPSQYIDFFENFERAVLTEILRYDPREVVILSNDSLCFRKLSEKGYSVFCLHHMNLADFVADVVLHDVVRVETLAALRRFLINSPLRFLVPHALDVVFRNQEESVVHVQGAIVPSEGLKRRFLRLYPELPTGRIHVIPWGSPTDVNDQSLVTNRADELRQLYGISRDTFVLITLSRISPEKGHDRLIKALKIWEEEDAGFPAGGICLLICGVAGYRQAIPYEKSLKESAKKLKKVKVIFPGYVHGLEKQAHFRLADLYVFPSRYESYGLTLMEAFRAGLPAVACFNDGTEQLVHEAFGELVPDAPERKIPVRLKEAIQRMLADPEARRTKGRQAQSFAEANSFSKTADYLIDLCLSSSSS
jgi:glycosyltransferase involved in cell wall biosynthesis